MNGCLEGMTISWHRNGRIAMLGEYRDSLRQGLWRCWDEQGFQLECRWLDGILHGRLTERDPDGKIVFEAYYLNGVEISSGVLPR